MKVAPGTSGITRAPFLRGVVERVAEAPVRLLVDHRGVAAVVGVGVALGDDALGGLRRTPRLALGEEEVVGGEAGLAGVHELGVEDAVGGGLDVVVVAR